MTWHEHPDASRIVRDHVHEAECFIVAQNTPCIGIRDAEVQHADRFLHGGFPNDLARWKRPTIWFIAVILCPGDDTVAVTHYIKEQGLDPQRVHFYLHPKAKLTALAAWRDAGFPLDRVDTEGRNGAPFTSWKALHAVLGRHLSVQILDDVLGR